MIAQPKFDAPPRPQFTLDEWQAEGARRFGKRYRAWTFICARCGHMASAQDFADLEADPTRAYSECIGRVMLEKGKARDGIGGFRPEAGKDSVPCDWAAFGLFGTLNGGTKITDIPADKGRDPERWVFDFGPTPVHDLDDLRAAVGPERLVWPVRIFVPTTGQNVQNVCKDLPALETAWKIAATAGPPYLEEYRR